MRFKEAAPEVGKDGVETLRVVIVMVAGEPAERLFQEALLVVRQSIRIGYYVQSRHLTSEQTCHVG